MNTARTLKLKYIYKKITIKLPEHVYKMGFMPRQDITLSERSSAIFF